MGLKGERITQNSKRVCVCYTQLGRTHLFCGINPLFMKQYTTCHVTISQTQFRTRLILFHFVGTIRRRETMFPIFLILLAYFLRFTLRNFVAKSGMRRVSFNNVGGSWILLHLQQLVQTLKLLFQRLD